MKRNRGFPFDEEEGSSAWSELASRHPDIAARLRARPSTWARKRRPSSQDASDEFGGFGEQFEGFPFDDIPPEFREHFPSRWNRRFGSREEPAPPQQPPPTQPPHPQPHSHPHPHPHTTTSTQTEPAADDPHQSLPQYGLRNTVDLGQKSPADPSLVDAEDRSQRSMSAPPDGRTGQRADRMSGHHPPTSPPDQAHSNVRHIPIFVEGRDEPVMNKSPPHHAEPKPSPPVDREQYFADETPVNFHHPPNFSRAFGTPFAKGFRQPPQPFAQQKAYPQASFARGASPRRSQSPKPHDEYVKVPVHHEHPATKAEHPPSKPQQQPQQQHPQQHPQQQHPQQHPQQQHPQQQHPQQQQQQQQPPPAPEPKPQPSPNDPITLILSIQTDVLNLMTEVENFTGKKNDKQYMFLDEMLTRNLIKLDNIETDGKENIRQARKEAIKCIQKCIEVLEVKAENRGVASPAPPDVDMKESDGPTAANGEVEVKEATKENELDQKEETPQEIEKKDQPETEAADTRPDGEATQDKKSTKGKKVVKKRDKSKDKKDGAIVKEEAGDKAAETTQVDGQGDANTQEMEVDPAAAPSQ